MRDGGPSYPSHLYAGGGSPVTGHGLTLTSESAAGCCAAAMRKETPIHMLAADGIHRALYDQSSSESYENFIFNAAALELHEQHFNSSMLNDIDV